MRTHLELMSKPRLIALIRDTQTRNTHLEHEVRRLRTLLEDRNTRTIRALEWEAADVPPERTRALAQKILDALPVDPDADEHRETLAHAVWSTNARVAATPAERRCWRADSRRPLDPTGRCAHCYRPSRRTAA